MSQSIYASYSNSISAEMVIPNSVSLSTSTSYSILYSTVYKPASDLITHIYNGVSSIAGRLNSLSGNSSLAGHTYLDESSYARNLLSSLKSISSVYQSSMLYVSDKAVHDNLWSSLASYVIQVIQVGEWNDSNGSLQSDSFANDLENFLNLNTFIGWVDSSGTVVSGSDNRIPYSLFSSLSSASVSVSVVNSSYAILSAERSSILASVSMSLSNSVANEINSASVVGSQKNSSASAVKSYNDSIAVPFYSSVLNSVQASVVSSNLVTQISSLANSLNVDISNSTYLSNVSEAILIYSSLTAQQVSAVSSSINASNELAKGSLFSSGISAADPNTQTIYSNFSSASVAYNVAVQSEIDSLNSVSDSASNSASNANSQANSQATSQAPANGGNTTNTGKGSTGSIKLPATGMADEALLTELGLTAGLVAIAATRKRNKKETAKEAKKTSK